MQNPKFFLISCPCEGETFTQKFKLFKVPGLFTETGKDAIEIHPVFYCDKCGAEIDFKTMKIQSKLKDL